MKLHNASAEVNPKLDHITFDPVVAEFEKRQDDRAWEREYLRQHELESERIRKIHHREVIDEDEMAQLEERGEMAERLRYRGGGGEEGGGEGDYGGEEDDGDEDGEHEDGDMNNPDDYFAYDHFNITSRLQTLFPLIDDNPSDGFVTVEELGAWHVKQGREANLHRTEREMEAVDTNHDGLLSLKEYLHDSSPGDEINVNLTDESNEWMRNGVEQWPLTDLDGDGLLNIEEYKDFQNPEDSDNPKLIQWLRKQEIKNRDKDKDGKLSFDEFYSDLYNELRDFGEEDPIDTAVRSHVGKDPHESRTHLTDAMEVKMNRTKAKFEELDVNKDGFLTEDELVPVMVKLNPGEKFFARQQAEHMVQQADENNDKKLSVEEMIKHPYVFYNVAYDQNEEDDDGPHDEFRR